MKILTIPKTFLVGLLFFFMSVQASNPLETPTQNSVDQQQSQRRTETVSVQPNSSTSLSALAAEISSEAMTKVRGTDYSPFAIEHGYNPEDIAETCAYFEEFLAKDRLEQARIEALCGEQKTKIFDWKTSFWNSIRWVLGTSRNFAAISVVGLAVFANVFPSEAVKLATAAGAIEGIGALLYKMHKYCKERKLEQIGYNLVVMNGQAAVRMNRAKAKAHLDLENEMTEMEEGRTATSSSSDDEEAETEE